MLSCPVLKRPRPALTRLVPLMAMLAQTQAATATAKGMLLSFAGDDGHLRTAVVRALRAHGFQASAPEGASAPAAGGAADPTVAAVVDGRLQTRGWKSVLTLHARSVPSGARIASATFAGAPRQLARDITRHLDRRLGRALASAVTGHHHRRLANDARMEPLEQPSARPRPPHAHAADAEDDEPLAHPGP